MRFILRPDFKVKNLYLDCINRMRDADLKSRLISVFKTMINSDRKYHEYADIGNLYLIKPHDNIGKVISNKEIEKFYTNRIVKPRSPGRIYYEQLIASAPDGICPFCGQRTVSTLDHYLPKMAYPSFCITPLNLVPSCIDCNKNKIDKAPKTPEDQTLHPYYDDLTTEQWLYGEVIEELPASIRFYVKTPDAWNKILRSRVLKHFNTFKLGSLYASHAATELANIRYQLLNILERVGPESVRDHLIDMAESCHRNHINSWQTAMYQAIANNNWFCNGGFNI